jgi:hypothetical protein
MDIKEQFEHLIFNKTETASFLKKGAEVNPILDNKELKVFSFAMFGYIENSLPKSMGQSFISKKGSYLEVFAKNAKGLVRFIFESSNNFPILQHIIIRNDNLSKIIYIFSIQENDNKNSGFGLSDKNIQYQQEISEFIQHLKDFTPEGLNQAFEGNIEDITPPSWLRISNI